MSTTLLAYHGDPAIKARYLARVRAHRAADDIIRGTYGCEEGLSGWRGCAVGCTLHSGDHAAYEAEIGIPRALAHLEDTLFERMPIEYAPDWPVEFLEAIPVGADLSRVVWQVLARGISDLLRLATEGTRPAMERVIGEVLEPLARGETVEHYLARGAARGADAAARGAYAAARAAAYAADAAADAADAAADAARGAYAAARGAAYAADAARGAYAAADAAADAADAAAFQWSRWLLEFMAMAPIPAREEAAQ